MQRAYATDGQHLILYITSASAHIRPFTLSFPKDRWKLETNGIIKPQRTGWHGTRQVNREAGYEYQRDDVLLLL